MTQFLGDIAGILEIFAIAAGLVVLHKASKEPAAKFLKAAGLVLIIGGIAVGLCTSFYWFKYQAAGDFDRAMPGTHMMSGAMPGMQMMPGSMPGTHMMPGMHTGSEPAAQP